MLFLLSPAKTLDFNKSTQIKEFSIPYFIEDTKNLVNVLKLLSKKQLSELMNISEKIASTNYTRFKEFTLPFTCENAKQAILAYKGDVYTAIDLNSFNEDDFRFSQQHCRILSGLYGLLKPLDLIQPYRLEMDINLKTSSGNNIYEFWGDKLTLHLNKELKDYNYNTILNLASNEYFNAINPNKLEGKLLKITFKENRDGQYKIIGILAKKARGKMAEFIIKNKITSTKDLQDFCTDGYAYNKALSSKEELVYLR